MVRTVGRLLLAFSLQLLHKRHFSMRLSICSWNILADCYTRGQSKVDLSLVEESSSSTTLSTYSLSSSLLKTAAKTTSPSSWKYRSQLIRECLISIASDIYCLQEVDHYSDFYNPFFQEIGYHSLYLRRPAGKKDGCLIAYPMNRFDCLDMEEIDLDRLSYLDHLERGGGGGGGGGGSGGSRGGGGGRAGLEVGRGIPLRSKYAKQNVALLLCLQDKTSPTSRPIIIATCHVHWNPNLPEVKFAQTQLILEELTRFEKKCQILSQKGGIIRGKNENPSEVKSIPIILTGDFNSFPHDDLYALVTGKISLEKNQYFFLSSPASSSSSTNAQERNQTPATIRKFYGPNTKFLCDFSLTKLCRWMRILGIDVAMEGWETSNQRVATLVTSPVHNNGEDGNEPQVDEEINFLTKIPTQSSKSASINAFFIRARKEKRVILTSSKMLITRSMCPHSFYIQPNRLEESLINLFYQYGLDLNRERFLTVCGKCGGEIEEIEEYDYRYIGKIIPTDRQIYGCKSCAQPYWWNDEENSSPAKAMRKAEELYQMISKGLAKFSILPSEQSMVVSKEEKPPEDEEVEEEGRDQKQSSSDEDETTQNPSDPPSTTMNLSEMFAKRNQIVSQGLLKSSSIGEDSTKGIGSETASLKITPAEEDEANGAAKLLELEEKMNMNLSSSHELIKLQSIFQDREPVVTNWNGEFQGTLDYVFIDSKSIKVLDAQVLPRLEKNSHLFRLPREGEKKKDKGPEVEIFQQLVEQSPPSLTWPSDHFMLYTQLLIE